MHEYLICTKKSRGSSSLHALLKTTVPLLNSQSAFRADTHPAVKAAVAGALQLLKVATPLPFS